MSTVQSRILDLIRRSGRGKVFTSKDFLDLGSRDAIDQGLARLANAGDVERLGRGLYYYPRLNARLNLRLPPDPDDVAAAIGRKRGSRVAPSGAVAANRLGLTTQVPARAVYLTDGRGGKVQVGDMVFVMKRVAPKEFPPGSPTSAAVVQALRHLGRDAVDDRVIARLRRTLPAQDRRKLLRDARYTTDWIAGVLRQVARVDSAQEVAAHG